MKIRKTNRLLPLLLVMTMVLSLMVLIANPKVYADSEESGKM